MARRAQGSSPRGLPRAFLGSIRPGGVSSLTNSPGTARPPHANETDVPRPGDLDASGFRLIPSVRKAEGAVEAPSDWLPCPQGVTAHVPNGVKAGSGQLWLLLIVRRRAEPASGGSTNPAGAEERRGGEKGRYRGG